MRMRLELQRLFSLRLRPLLFLRLRLELNLLLFLRLRLELNLLLSVGLRPLCYPMKQQKHRLYHKIPEKHWDL
jgi:hypothetical protein